MLKRVFPSPADFTYRGSKIALLLLGLILLVKLAIALGAIFNGHSLPQLQTESQSTPTHRKRLRPFFRSSHRSA